MLGGAVACADSQSHSSAAATGATARSASRTPADTDDFGAPLPRDASAAARVVSLNPAATEIIYAIGAESHLVGRSRWDEFPEAAKAVPSLGDGIKPNVEAVLAAKPTLVVLYATADNRPAAEAFARAGVRTLAVRVDRIAQFHSLVHTLGIALGESQRAQTVSDSVRATLERVEATMNRLVPAAQRPTVVWPVWLTPPMVIGAGSYMDELLSIAGAVNVFHDQHGPSPQVSVEEIISRNPAVVVTSEKRAAELRASPTWGKLPAIAQGAVALDDPKLAGRPSVVLGMAAVQLARALHPPLSDSIR
jgi:ABC-type Fe3+-hydroxamate transport system substrate-binding protein